MSKEIAGATDKAFQNLKLKESDIFGSTEPPIFTQLGSCLYGFIVIHMNDIEEARRDGTSDMRLREMMTIETEKKLVSIEEEWKKKIPRNAFAIGYVEKQFLELLGGHQMLSDEMLSLAKR